MFDLEPINSSIKKIIEKIGKGKKEEIKVLRQERIAQEIFLFHTNNSLAVIKWNYLCLKGEPLTNPDFAQMKKQTKELSGLIDELCKIFDMSRSEMENELNLLIKFERGN